MAVLCGSVLVLPSCLARAAAAAYAAMIPPGCCPCFLCSALHLVWQGFKADEEGYVSKAAQVMRKVEGMEKASRGWHRVQCRCQP